jgi:hypothetical protein
MIQVVSRSDIFKQSVFVDNQIAIEQQAIHRTINQQDADEIAYTMPLLDHLLTLQPQSKALDGFCVLAYDAETKEDYESNFPSIMVNFFAELKINELYLLTTCKTDWKDFEFSNKAIKKRFFRIVNQQTNAVGFLLSVSDLLEMLPLFFNTHPDHPHINLIPSQEGVSISMLLCKDGNFHTLFDERIQMQIQAAAAETGLCMGSFEICQLYKNN